MISVADVLKLDLLTGAVVVAGHDGLNNHVQWVHNAGVPDAPAWLNGGELVLTTYINMPETPEDQQQYVRKMAEKGVAGLMLAVGRYVEHVPEYLCAVASECHFPLVEIPYTTRFVDIARAVIGRIAQENMEMVERTLTIQKELTRLVLEGGGFQQLAGKLCEFVGHSISIENERFEVIATQNIAEVDEARRYTQQHGRTDPRLVDALENRGYLPAIRASLRPVQLPVMEDVGLEMERILAPIVVHGDIYGFMWVIADVHSISDIDMMAIESGATIAALIILYQESVQSAEASLKGSLLSQLIQGDSGRETVLTDQSLRYGLDLRSPWVMLLLEMPAGNTQSLTRTYRTINNLTASENWHAVVGQFAGEVVLLVQAHESLPAMAYRILERAANGRRGEQAVRLGMSSVLQGAEQVKRAHRQCRDVLHITRRLRQEARVVYFAELGYLHALYLAGKDSLLDNPHIPLLRRLLEQKQVDLFNTLEAYLETGGNGVSTADVLHIHRSTLNYRLARIVQICEVDLQNPAVQIDLQIALKLLRLFEMEPGSGV